MGLGVGWQQGLLALLGCYAVGGCFGVPLWWPWLPSPASHTPPALPHVDSMADVPAWNRCAWGVGRFSVWLACALGAWHLGGWGCWGCCCLRRGSGPACGCFGGGVSWIGPLRKDDRSSWRCSALCVCHVWVAVLSSCQALQCIPHAIVRARVACLCVSRVISCGYRTVRYIGADTHTRVQSAVFVRVLVSRGSRTVRNIGAATHTHTYCRRGHTQ